MASPIKSRHQYGGVIRWRPSHTSKAMPPSPRRRETGLSPTSATTKEDGGKGFVGALTKRWEGPEAAYRSWYKDRSQNDFELGAVQLVSVEPNLWVANMVAQHGYQATHQGPPIRYDAVRKCLAKLAAEAKNLEASVHMPRIGCGLAGGKWEEIEPIISDELTSPGIEVSVYDFG